MLLFLVAIPAHHAWSEEAIVVALECPPGGYELQGRVDCNAFSAAVSDEFQDEPVSFVQVAGGEEVMGADLAVGIEEEGQVFVLVLRDPAAEHEYRREIPSTSEGDFDPDSASLLLRGLLASFLYESLEEIEPSPDLHGIVVPPGKEEVLHRWMGGVPASSLVSIETGYALIVDPAVPLASHGLIGCLGASPLQWLRLHVGFMITIPARLTLEEPEVRETYDLVLTRVTGVTGVTFRVVRLRRLSVWAGAGMYLGMVRLEVSEKPGGGSWTFPEFECSAFFRTAFKVHLVEGLSLKFVMEASGVVNPTELKHSPGSDDVMYGPGRLRLLLAAVLTAGP